MEDLGIIIDLCIPMSVDLPECLFFYTDLYIFVDKIITGTSALFTVV
jgi:hypothetical protein